MLTRTADFRRGFLFPSARGLSRFWSFPYREKDDEAHFWTAGVAQEWADELSDPEQDIYTLADGEPVRES